jgi:hypothetical protein
VEGIGEEIVAASIRADLISTEELDQKALIGIKCNGYGSNNKEPRPKGFLKNADCNCLVSSFFVLLLVFHNGKTSNKFSYI